MPHYAFGPFILDPETRVLRRGGEPIPLAAKTLDTLIVLVQNRGRLVDKDELLSRVWAGSVVEEANLTQSIFAVRKVLGDSPKDHRYIATIAGRGYQFVAPVAEAPAAEASPHAVWGRKRMLPFGAAGGALVALLLGTLFLLRPSGHDDAAPEPIPFTSDLGFADYPAFSPDGKQIAYSWTRDGGSASIYVKLVGGETKLRVTNARGVDLFPAWSPDGRNIAFYRRLPGHSGYYMVSALGGPERQLAPLDLPAALGPYRFFPGPYFLAGIDWFPDGKHVAVVLPTGAPENHQLIPGSVTGWAARHIVRLDVETGEELPMTTPPPKRPFGDIDPRISPDGKLLAFVRATTDSTGGIYLLALAPGAQPRRLNASLWGNSGMAWTPDSRGLVFAAWVKGRDRLWRVSIDGGTPRPITSGVENFSSPTVARVGAQLAYVVNPGHMSLWRMPILGSPPSGTGPPERFIESTQSESEPAYSRDGAKLAFASNRSGPEEIWAADADGRNSVQLTNCGIAGTPRWSPDGSTVAFDTGIKGNPEIMIVSAEGHRLRQITHNPAEDVVPNWSNDGRWIYFASNRSGQFRVYKVSASEGESPSSPAVQMTAKGGFYAEESPDGKYLYFSKGRDKRGLWRRPLNGSRGAPEEPVLESLRNWGWWTLGAHGVFFLEPENELPNAKVHLKFLDLTSRKITDLRTLEYLVFPVNAALAVSPDGRNVVVEQFENSGANIVLQENFG